MSEGTLLRKYILVSEFLRGNPEDFLWSVKGSEITRVNGQSIVKSATPFDGYITAMHRNRTIGHIGIAACSAPGAALCYETICAEGPALLGAYEHPEISLHAVSFAEHVRLLRLNDWAGVGEILLQSAEKLAKIGADFVICPDNTAHLGLDFVLARSPIPWLHIADAVAQAAGKAGYRRVGLLGTRALVESSLYPEKLLREGIDCCRPSAADRDTVDRIIFEELVHGRVTSQARAELAAIITRLKENDSCDAVILGCTELPLAITSDVAVLPTLDSTRLLARMALERAVAMRSAS